METLPALPTSQIESLISQAIDKNVPVETLERLLAMRNQLKAEYAREAFYTALADFQSQCPIIKKNKMGAVAAYATLDSIVSQVRSLIKQHGFSYMIQTETFDDRITAWCRVTHKDGHSESVSFTAHHLIKNKAISAAQLDAGTQTFAKRYAFCNAFGIMTGESDTDADVVVQYCTEDQIDTIRDLLTKTSYFEGDLLTKCNITDISELTFDRAEQIITNLNKLINT